MCQPCEIWKIFDSQRKKLLQEQEHRYADEEQKAILRLKKKKEMEEKLKETTKTSNCKCVKKAMRDNTKMLCLF